MDALPPGPTNKKADTPLYGYLLRLVRGEDLSFDDARGLFMAMISKDAMPAQIAAVLTALTAKGESPEELAGIASITREYAVKVETNQKDLIDISGTGSSSVKTFNVSTAAALVAAGAGLNVAKQSNHGVSSNFGSADVLAELGIKPSSEPSMARTSLSGTGLSFIYSPKFHPSLIHIANIKRELGLRTCLNLLGVMTNPANNRSQITGVWHHTLLEPVASALALLKPEKAWVVHGRDGLDEITISGDTVVVEVTKGQTKKLKIAPKDFGLKSGSLDGIKAHNAKESAAIIYDVLASRRRDEARSIIVINAAAALYVGGAATDPLHAARMAEQSIDSGQAQNKLERLIQLSGKK